MISLEERYQNFKKTIQECGSYLLTESDDTIKHNLFEEWKRLLRASDEIRKLLYW